MMLCQEVEVGYALLIFCLNKSQLYELSWKGFNSLV